MDQEMVIYEYRKINKYTIENIIKSELHFTHPSKFNDFSDCSVNLDYSRINNNQNFEELINNNPKYRDLSNINPQEIPNHIKYFQGNEDSPFLVSCFSEVNNDILMWSIYADNHRGICLGFEIDENNFKDIFSILNLNIFLKKVKYQSQKVKQCDMCNEDERNNMENFVLTKYKGWQHEREWRFLLFDADLNENDKNKGRNIKFKKTFLKQIIFGIKTSHENMNLIKNIIQKHYIESGANVDFYNAIEDEKNFLINIDIDN